MGGEFDKKGVLTLSFPRLLPTGRLRCHQEFHNELTGGLFTDLSQKSFNVEKQTSMQQYKQNSNRTQKNENEQVSFIEANGDTEK